MTEPRAMTGRVTLGNGEARVLASPGKGLGARILDLVIVVGGVIILVFVGFGGLVVGSGAPQLDWRCCWASGGGRYWPF